MEQIDKKDQEHIDLAKKVRKHGTLLNKGIHKGDFSWENYEYDDITWSIVTKNKLNGKRNVIRVWWF